MVRNIIWDWNGTLLDDTWICYEIANIMLEERGLKTIPDFEQYRRIFRFPVIDWYVVMGYTFEEETYEQVADEFLILYNRMLPGCGLKDGAKEVTAELKDRGYRQILLSATGQDTLEKNIRTFGMAGIFEELLGQKNDLAFGKSERGRLYMQKCGMDPKETVLIGDTNHDFEVAELIGAGCILIDSGNQSGTVLEKCGTPIIHSLRELLPIFADQAG